ncbi:MAG TPA: ABC transporter permease [Nocardioides sp.]|nr:ABC transporter permease [Nocardioides sp.]
MAGFVIRRALSSVLVVVLTSLFVFVLFFKGLGNSPAENYCEQLGPGKCTPAKLQAIEHSMGLDQPVLKNYATWVKGIFFGRENVYVDGKSYDCPAPCLGISIMTGNTVWNDLKQKYPATVTVAVGGATIYLTFGVLLGVVAARWRGTVTDRAVVGGSLIVSAVPDYLIILLAWIFFSLRWQIFPDVGYYPISDNPAKTVAWMALPWLVLGATGLTDYARFTRGQMVETLHEDYIRTARAKGVRGQGVLFKHALRAAVVPVITIFGLDFAGLLSGTIFIEQIFGIDGIGHWGLQALSTPMDVNVISATVLVGAILVVVANLVVDILYGFMDPRVSVA